MTRRAHWIALAPGVVFGAVVGALARAASALFLFLLDKATIFRGSHRSLVYLLPVAGLVIGTIYERLGASVKAGNNLDREALSPARRLSCGRQHLFAARSMLLGGVHRGALRRAGRLRADGRAVQRRRGLLHRSMLDDGGRSQAMRSPGRLLGHGRGVRRELDLL